MRSFGYYSALSYNIYDRLNGEINTTIMSNQLVIEKLGSNIMGRSIFMSVFLNLVDIYEGSKRLKLSDEEVVGFILFTILHELSHCDQERDPLKAMQDNNYRIFVEYTNNMNTLSFINRNMKDLQSLFGPFEIPYITLERFYKEEQSMYGNKNVSYIQSKSFKDSLLFALGGFCNTDFHKLIKETGIHSLVLRLNILNETKLELEMIREETVKICKAELIYIENMFASSLFTYSSNICVDEKGRIIVNINSNNSPKLKVVEF